MDQQFQKRSFSSLLTRSNRSSPTRVGSAFPTRVGSASSNFSGLSLSEREKGDLGLTTLFTPANGSAAVADIIFIHGLGGGSRKTWSHSGDEHHYWPQSWLPYDPDFKDVRIHVFGYVADWADRQPSVLNITDFAQSLLGEVKNSPAIRQDETSIVLVGHSMGGCVMKKAYILARQDPACRGLADRIHSMFFLGTPHRGSDLALVLENMLTLTWGRKPFVKDLLPDSDTLTEINDAFRHYAPDLKLWSFYETLPIRTGLMNNKLVVEKLSSILGYPNEEVAAMNADHRHVCKFESPEDPNYRLLRNALHTAVDTIRASTAEKCLQSREVEQLLAIETNAKLLSFLDPDQALEDDLATLQVLQEPGSCEWLAKGASYATWMDGTDFHILWLTGRPGAGKSVLSSHVTNELKLSGSLCSYFIFKHGKNHRSTLSDCFRSLAYQMSLQDSFIRERLLKMAEDTSSWDMSDETSIWRRIFVGVIFQSPLLSQHVWVIDGVDECSNFTTLFTNKLLAAVPRSLRVFYTSRDLEEIRRGLIALGPRVHVHALSERDTLDDIRLFLTTKLTELDLLETDEERHGMCEKILLKSRGSFLWVRLVLQGFETTWTEEAMEAVLQDVPSDLGEVYHRILQSIEADPHKKMLAKSILAWVLLASRPLTTDELRCAIKMDTGQTVQKTARAIPSLCGQLVFVDQSNKAHIIHETAREFLLGRDLDSDLAIPEAHAHTRLSLLLVRYLSSNAMKVQSASEAPKERARGFASTRRSASTRGSASARGFASARSTPAAAAAAAAPDLGLLAYAAYFFSDHIYRCTLEDDLLIEELCLFLKSPNVLSWIEHISRGQDLSHLKRTAANLREYLRRRDKCVSPTDPQVHLVDGWVIDIIRVSAKFRSQLLACPSSIHCLIPPLCPPDSNIFKSFSTRTKPSPLVVKNLPNGSWGDCLVRIDYTTRGLAMVVSQGDEAFAVGFSLGRVLLYSSVSLQQVGEFSHPERVQLLEFSPGCEYLVSGSKKHLVVWNVRTGASMFSFGLQSEPLSVTFLSDSELLTASPTGGLTKWDFHTGEQDTVGWPGFDDHDPSAPSIPDQLPTKMAFSGPLPDYKILLAVCYPNHPILIWDSMELQLLGKCETTNGQAIRDMVFNPNYEIPALVVSYASGDLVVFDYTTLKIDTCRPRVFAERWSFSKDGQSLACRTEHGTIDVFEFDRGCTGNIELTPIYRINSVGEYWTKDMAFHPEGLRFVGITKRQCRVWEPAARFRRDSRVEVAGDVVPLPHKTVGAVIAPHQPHISTSLTASKDGRFIVGGNKDGQVILFSAKDGSELGTAYSHDQGALIGSLVFADSGGVVASSARDGRVIVAELPPGEGPSFDLPLKIILDQSHGGHVEQLLFSPEANHLLVVTWKATELWGLPQGILLGRHQVFGDFTPKPSVIHHPSDPTLFIYVSGKICRIFNWADFSELTTTDGVQRLDPTYIDLSTSRYRSYHHIPGVGVLEHRVPFLPSPGHLILWPTTAFDQDSDISGHSLEDDGLEALGPIVHSVLGIIGGTRVVFLDTHLWICSFDLRLSPATHVRSRSRSPGPLSGRSRTPAPDQNMISHIRRHFFAMSEWTNNEGMMSSLMVPLICLMVPSGARSARDGGHNFAFVAGRRIVLVQGGLDFSETVTLGSSGQQWTVVSGTMHRRSSNW